MSGKITHNPAAGDSIAKATYNADSYHLIGGEASKEILTTTDVDSTPTAGHTTNPISSDHAKTHEDDTAAHGATATPTANRIPIADGSGFLDDWLSSSVSRICDDDWDSAAWLADTLYAPSRRAVAVVLNELLGITGSTGLDLYGAGAYPYVDTVGPVGGGSGYVDILSWALADYVVTSVAEFITAAGDADGTAGKKYIYLAEGTHLHFVAGDVPSGGIVIDHNVVVFSTRGYAGTHVGAVLEMTSETGSETFPNFLKILEGARLTGIQIIGPNSTLWQTDPGSTDAAKQTKWTGIDVYGNAASEIDNCVVSQWAYSGISIHSDAEDTEIHHCYIHHCAMMGYGYGIEVYYVECTITANIMDYNRHCIAGGRGNTTDGPRYSAWYNIFEEHNMVGQSLDWHGGNDSPASATDCAGYSGTVAYNTFKTVTFATGTTPTISYVPTPCSIRGYPHVNLDFHHNWFYLNWSERYCISQSANNIGGTLNNYPWTNITVSQPNWYGLTPPGTGGSVSSADDFVTLTIASGAVVLTEGKRNFIIAAESGTTDTLTTITGGIEGQEITVMADTGDTITLDHDADNIWMRSHSDLAISDSDRVTLKKLPNGDWAGT